ncbi:MAG: SDR family NAD(P)-dependent oxidoreductase, partial [Clostridia bacterium]|nr:SDR family NAD(P)-dependent oxidoreductase [Clostridia bacterium]
MSICVDLAGHVAVVTGASGQIGRVISRRLAEAGADVVVHYHSNEDMANTVVQEIRAMGRRAVAIQADISDPDSVSSMAEDIKR